MAGREIDWVRWQGAGWIEMKCRKVYFVTAIGQPNDQLPNRKICSDVPAHDAFVLMLSAASVTEAAETFLQHA